jgi:hypothetical protein
LARADKNENENENEDETENEDENESEERRGQIGSEIQGLEWGLVTRTRRRTRPGL